MVSAVDLVPLNCIRCGYPIPAEIDEVAWACEQCGQGQQLNEDGLIPLQVLYSENLKPSQKGRPFWVCEGRVTINRDTYDKFGKKNQDALDFWAAPRQFYVPACTYPWDEFSGLGVKWLYNPPILVPGPAVAFQAVTVAAEDIAAWAEFLVVALEAKRKDKVKKIEFKLTMGEPQLWILE
jgi:hypothetical protein